MKKLGLAVLALVVGAGCPVRYSHRFKTPKVAAGGTLPFVMEAARFTADGRWALLEVDGGWSIHALSPGTVTPAAALRLDAPAWKVSDVAAGASRAVSCEARTITLWQLAWDPAPAAEAVATAGVDTVAKQCEDVVVAADGAWAVTWERSTARIVSRGVGQGNDVFEANVLRLWRLGPPEAPAIELAAEERFESQGVQPELELSPDGRWLAWRAGGSPYRLWELEREGGGRIRAAGELFHGRDGRAQELAFAPDGEWAVTAETETLVMWRLTAGGAPQALATVEPAPSGSRASMGLAISPDGGWLVSAELGPMRLFRVDPTSPTPLTQTATLSGHGGILRDVTFSPDGRRLLSGAQDRVAELWTIDPATGAATPAATLAGHRADVTRVAISADGRTAFTTSYDDTTRVWPIAD